MVTKLPRIEHPTFTLKIPSTKQSVVFRPFLVKEEKLLLIAQSSDDPADVVRAVKQVVNNCIMTEGVDVNEFTSYDLEYFFIKLRARSINNIITLSYKDLDDGEIYDVEVNLDQIEVVGTEFDSTVKVDDNISLKLRHPRVDIIDKMKDITTETDFNYAISVSCIDTIFTNDESFKMSEVDPQEAQEFMDGLNIETFQAIQNFIDKMPRINHVVSYTNSHDKKVEITLSTLNDFFALG